MKTILSTINHFKTIGHSYSFGLERYKVPGHVPYICVTSILASQVTFLFVQLIVFELQATL